jgi:hypothetical protein
METNFSVQCPFCGEFIWMEFYPEDGTEQEMIVDCEVCCNPILYAVTFKGDYPTVRVERAQ